MNRKDFDTHFVVSIQQKCHEILLNSELMVNRKGKEFF